MMRRLFVGLLLALSALSVPAQVGVPGDQVGLPNDKGTPSVSTGSVPLTYVGGDTRVSVGVDQDGHTQGELSGVFDKGDHAIVAQLWWQHGGAGGIQADYNWLWGTTLEQARKDPDSITVAKLSFAIDQNSQKDRQANVGFAIERKEFFLDFFLSGKASGSRGAGALNVQQQTTSNGTDEVGTFTQTQTDVTTTLLEAQPYAYTVGVHGGHFSDVLAARFNGGIDYSKGHQGASQKRASVGIDKYIGTHGWSVSGVAEHAQLSSPVERDRNDNRWWLFLRYEFGGAGVFLPTSQTADSAWIQRALREPVTGHSRTVDTYVTRGKTSKTTSRGPKQYTALRPLARDDQATVAQNSSANAIDVLANDSDPDGNPLTITAVTTPANGTVQISGNKAVYTPTQGYVGTDQFDYTITNTKQLTASAHVRVTVSKSTTPPPGPPVARDDAATTPYATAVAVNVLANDSDPNGYALTVTSTTAPAHGTVRINPDGSVTYTPLKTYIGTDSFSYSISNGHEGTASANVIITVQPPLPPVARDDTATTPNATPVTIDVLANDTSPGGFLLTVTSVSAPSNGTAKINTGGSVTYTPNIGFSGSDAFSYSINDGHGGIASANVSVTVAPAGGTFVANNDSAVTAYATPVNINVLANDVAPTGSTLTLKSVTTPAHGTAQIGSGGVITYTPSAAFNGGPDAFTYTVSDGPDSLVANVSVTVQPPGAPVAQNDTANTAFKTPVTINVLANDSDPNSLALTVTQVTQPAHGTAQINADNTVTYTPQPTYTGGDSFSYTISNGHGGTASANVGVTVGSAPPPVPQNDAATTPFNKPVIINVLANDSDPSGLSLSVTQVTAPQHGTAQINTDNTVTYTPQSTYSGPDSFNYTVGNGHGGSASASVSVTVQPPLPPVAVDDSATTPFATPVKISVLANDSDPNGLPLSIVSAGPPGNPYATIVVNADNTITYTPDTEIGSSDTFSYTITDGYNTATANVSVTVLPAQPPVARNDSVSTPFNTAATISVLSNDSDPQNLSLFIIGVTQPAHGTVVNNFDGTVTYTPGLFVPPGWALLEPYVGTDSFTYTVSDGVKNATATVSVVVQLPPPPVANADVADCQRDGSTVSVPVVANDTDAKALPLIVVAFSQPASADTTPGSSRTTLNGDKVSITYQSPDPSFLGDVDSFTYTISDPYMQTATATVTIHNTGP